MIITVEPELSIDEVKHAAAGRWLEILSQNGLPYDLLDGKHHACPKCGGTDRFRLMDAHSGAVICNQCFNKKNGDGLAALQWLIGCEFKDAIKIVAQHCGLVSSHSGSVPQPQRDLIELVCMAKRMPVEAFLQFNPTIATRGRNREEVVRVPVYDESGKPHSYFDLTSNGKGWFARGKGMAGMFFPNRLPKPGETWLLVEGVKDAAALIGLGFNAAGLPKNVMAAKFARLFSGCDVVVVPDLDDGGQSGSQTTGGRLVGIANSVRVARLPGEIVRSGGDDVRDVLRAHGADAIRLAIDSATLWTPSEGKPDKEEGKPEVVLTSNLNFAVDMVAKYVGLLGWDSPWIPAVKRERAKVYQRGGELVQVVIESDESEVRGVSLPAGTARIRPLPTAQLVLRVADSCKLIRESESDTLGLVRKECQPEKWLVEGVATCGYWENVRRLEAVITSPTIRSDGSILQRAGWDSQTGLLYLPGKARFKQVPDKPTLQDAQQAVSELVEVVADFPFEAEADRSAWLAMVLTMIGRSAVSGCCPLFAISATCRGSGKSLLMDAASLIAYGRAAARKTYPTEDNEMRKTITAVALEALPAVLLDNVNGTLGGASIDAAITADRWTDRLLSFNKTTGELPLRTVWSATGNNLRFGSDTARRVVPIRLSPQIENPEERDDFQHSDLIRWVTSNRERLAVAALTVLRAYFVAGKPSQAGGQFGSFESWSDVIRGAIVWTGLNDPLDTRESAKADDTSASIVAGLIGGLIELDDTGDGITAREIAKALNDQNNQDKFSTMREVVAEIATTKGLVDARRLGNQLRNYRGRVAKGWKIEGVLNRSGVTCWRTVKVQTKGAGSAGSAGSESTCCPSEIGVVPEIDNTHTRNTYTDGLETDPAHPAHPADRMYFDD